MYHVVPEVADAQSGWPAEGSPGSWVASLPSKSMTAGSEPMGVASAQASLGGAAGAAGGAVMASAETAASATAIRRRGMSTMRSGSPSRLDSGTPAGPVRRATAAH